MDVTVRGTTQAPAAAWAGTYTLPNGPTSVALARLLVSQALADCPPEWVASAQLAVSELVTNGIKHAETGLALRIELDAPGIRITVEDGSPELPVRRPMIDLETQGRGLRIVDVVASSWGWEPTPFGKQVWFVVP